MEQATQLGIPAAPNGASADRQAEVGGSTPAGSPWAYPAPAASAPPLSACPRCGIPAAFGASFCASCGTPLGLPAQATQTAPYSGGPYAPAPGFAPYAGSYPPGVPYAGWQVPNGMTIALPAAPGGALMAPYAGFWLRFAAWLLDMFAIAVITFAVAAIAIIVLDLAAPNPGGYDSNRTVLMQVALIAVPWLYYTVAESSRHQGTFGKRMIGLRVVDESGRRISFARANGRFWSKQLSALMLGIGYLVCAFTQRKQALHDLISGCYVVSIRR